MLCARALPARTTSQHTRVQFYEMGNRGRKFSFDVGLGRAQQSNDSDEGGRILALEKAWNHALEQGSRHAPGQHHGLGRQRRQHFFPKRVSRPIYQPAQAVTEQTAVQVCGDAAVVVGIFRVKGAEKGKPFVLRERFVDT
jgi:hypothetical protein